MVNLSRPRLGIAGLALSALGFVTLIGFEGYAPVAVPPLPGDVPTDGFGSTGPDIKAGDRTTPVKAVQRAYRDTTTAESAIKRCVTVPLSQGEYDAYTSLAYNIGAGAFCRSTLVKKANALDYAGACAEISRFDKFQGRPQVGLTIRRAKERVMCEGAS